MSRAPVLMRHGGLWMADPCYRAAWLTGPQIIGVLAVAWLFASPRPVQAPPPPSVAGRWMRPIHSSEKLASLKALRDQATTDPGALAQLDHQALTGNSLAQFFMGTLDDPNLHLHPSNPPDAQKAARFYRQAADQGVDVAAINLGILLLGQPSDGIAKDYAEARRLFERAAPTTPIGVRELGLMKRYGWGEPMDPAGGMQMIRSAAEQGDAGAQRLLGLAYDTGESGLPHDAGEAVAWLQKAAAQDDARAERQLGLHLKTGDGIAADPAAADAVAQKEVEAAAPQP